MVDLGAGPCGVHFLKPLLYSFPVKTFRPGFFPQAVAFSTNSLGFLYGSGPPILGPSCLFLY